MKVIALVENTSINKEIIKIHGLSFYIEENNQKLLFDLGPNELIYKNAAALNIDLGKIDKVIISHGHDDHGGGLATFLKYNGISPIYIRKNAFKKYFAEVSSIREYIGLDQRLAKKTQIHFTNDLDMIDKDITTFSNIKKSGFMPAANECLYTEGAGKLKPDDFSHEQNLIVHENGNYYLFAGCAHSGILNIIEKAEAICGKEMTYVFSGFHLHNPDTQTMEKEEIIIDLANELKKRSTIYYTCHCTGQAAFQILEKVLKNQVRYISGGQEVICP